MLLRTSSASLISINPKPSASNTAYFSLQVERRIQRRENRPSNLYYAHHIAVKPPSFPQRRVVQAVASEPLQTLLCTYYILLACKGRRVFFVGVCLCRNCPGPGEQVWAAMTLRLSDRLLTSYLKLHRGRILELTVSRFLHRVQLCWVRKLLHLVLLRTSARQEARRALQGQTRYMRQQA